MFHISRGIGDLGWLLSCFTGLDCGAFRLIGFSIDIILPCGAFGQHSKSQNSRAGLLKLFRI